MFIVPILLWDLICKSLKHCARKGRNCEYKNVKSDKTGSDPRLFLPLGPQFLKTLLKNSKAYKPQSNYNLCTIVVNNNKGLC